MLARVVHTRRNRTEQSRAESILRRSGRAPFCALSASSRLIRRRETRTGLIISITGAHTLYARQQQPYASGAIVHARVVRTRIRPRCATTCAQVCIQTAPLLALYDCCLIVHDRTLSRTVRPTPSTRFLRYLTQTRLIRVARIVIARCERQLGSKITRSQLLPTGPGETVETPLALSLIPSSGQLYKTTSQWSPQNSLSYRFL